MTMRKPKEYLIELEPRKREKKNALFGQGNRTPTISMTGRSQKEVLKGIHPYPYKVKKIKSRTLF